MEKTVIAGVIVFVISQYFLKLILEPVLELKRVVSKVGFSLFYYGDFLHPPNLDLSKLNDDGEKKRAEEKILEMRKELRDLASQLHYQPRLIPFFKFLGKIFFLPDGKSLRKASDHLVFLHNIQEKDKPDEIENYKRDVKESLGLIPKTSANPPLYTITIL